MLPTGVSSSVACQGGGPRLLHGVDGVSLFGWLDNDILLGLENVDLVRHRLLRTIPACRIVRQHDVDLDSQHTLAKQDVAHSGVDEVTARVTSLDHVTILEFHALSALSPELARDNDLATEGTTLHDEAQDTVASPADSEASKELVAEGLGLSHSAETTVEDLLGVQLNGSSREVEPLLHNCGQLANAAALLTEHVLGAGGTDDDLVTSGGLTNLDARVAIFGQLTHEQLVQLGVEDAIGNKLAFL